MGYDETLRRLLSRFDAIDVHGGHSDRESDTDGVWSHVDAVRAGITQSDDVVGKNGYDDFAIHLDGVIAWGLCVTGYG